MRLAKVVVAMMHLIVVGMAWGTYATFDEAFVSGDAKRLAGDYEGARAAFLEAEGMTIIRAQISRAKLFFAHACFNEAAHGDRIFDIARAKYNEVLAYPNVTSVERCWAQFQLGVCAYEEANFQLALTELGKVKQIPYTQPYWVAEAITRMGMVYVKQNELASAKIAFLEVLGTQQAGHGNITYCVDELRKLGVEWPVIFNAMIEPTDAESFYALGMIQMKANEKLLSAAISFSRALKMLDAAVDIEQSKQYLARRNHDWFRITGQPYTDWYNNLSATEQAPLR